jgi:hypothetical protein
MTHASLEAAMKALEPFAAIAETICPHVKDGLSLYRRHTTSELIDWREITVGDLRAAKAAHDALSAKVGEGDALKPPMKLRFTDEWLRNKITSDPDEENCEAGVLHPEAPRLRFFIEHGVIHDRKTGKHVRACNCLAPYEDGTEAACDLLNSLAITASSPTSAQEKE